jgi:hypothetical protein
VQHDVDDQRMVRCRWVYFQQLVACDEAQVGVKFRFQQDEMVRFLLGKMVRDGEHHFLFRRNASMVDGVSLGNAHQSQGSSDATKRSVVGG